MTIIRVFLHICAFSLIWYPLLKNISGIGEKKRLTQLFSLLLTALFIWAAAFFSLNSLLRGKPAAAFLPFFSLVSEFIPLIFILYIYYRAKRLLRFAIEDNNMLTFPPLIAIYLVTISFILRISPLLPPVAPYRWNLLGYPRAAIGTSFVILLPALLMIFLDGIFFYLSVKKDHSAQNRNLFLLEISFWYGVFLWHSRVLFNPLKPFMSLFFIFFSVLIILRILRIYISMRNLSGKTKMIISGIHLLFLALAVFIFKISIVFDA